MRSASLIFIPICLPLQIGTCRLTWLLQIATECIVDRFALSAERPCLR